MIGMAAQADATSLVAIVCPGCKAKYRIRAQFVGRTASCTHCGRRFKAGDVADDTQPSGNAETADPRIETRLGNFQICGILGRGGMGTVYEAEDLTLGRR